MSKPLEIAVLTFTRDRLDYTKHCFATLEENAGCEYDHYVLDQASTDGTLDWLNDWYEADSEHRTLCYSDENIGICRGANLLLNDLMPEKYDVIVRYDNDCEVTYHGTLAWLADIADGYGIICAPRVLGLQNPPAMIRTVMVNEWALNETAILGGIFMAIPSNLFWEHGFRFDEESPYALGDEAIVPWWRARGGVCGYLQDVTVNHYETTLGQRERYPEYEARKADELASQAAVRAAGLKMYRERANA